jgi:integrase
VIDAEFKAVHAKVDQTLRDAMDLALLTGQRPADVLKIMRADIRDGALFVTQNKTGARRTIEIVGELAEVIDRIGGRERERLSAYLVQDDNGRPLSQLAWLSSLETFGPRRQVTLVTLDIPKDCLGKRTER